MMNETPTILIVHDHSVNRELLVALLEGSSYRILEAGDGSAALAMVREHRPALVIADLLMPVMDGWEFLRCVRSDPNIAQTRVIFCSAHYGDATATALARRYGVTEIIHKPIDPQSILESIKRSLQETPESSQTRRHTS